MTELITWLERQIELCDDLKSMEKEKWAFIQTLKKVRKEAINYSQCCTQLPSKEEMNNRLYALANELKTDDKQTEKIYFESGFRYCQQVIKEHSQK